MIYVKRDVSLIPQKVLQVAERAQAKLETLPVEERTDFIKKKSHIWRKFSRYLSKMSHGKCWYSESSDTQSFFDVDHFRPKLEAKISETYTDAEGYQWLAFDWENFRLASQRSNRQSKDEDTKETVGKGSWFPLLEGSPKANWNDRCVEEEKPTLLDPINVNDVNLLDIADDGRVVPSPTCLGTRVHRVSKSVELYGLNLPRLKEARLAVIREVTKLHDIIMRTADGLKDAGAVADSVPLEEQIDLLKSKTRPESPFSKAARAQLSRLPYGAHFIAKPEEAA